MGNGINDWLDVLVKTLLSTANLSHKLETIQFELAVVVVLDEINT
jgi:hypothetical protein